MLVQNRVSLAMPLLPDVVRQTGVTTRKRSPDILMTVSMNSPDGRYDQLYLSNYALMRMRDELSRLPGISEVLVFGQRDYSMRIWVDPDKLAVAQSGSHRRRQRASASRTCRWRSGRSASRRPSTARCKQMPLDTRGRLTDAEEFENIVIKFTARSAAVMRIRDVGRVELGAAARTSAIASTASRPSAWPIFQLPDANALETADRVKAKDGRAVRTIFPTASVYEIGYDTTPFIRESVSEVFKALRDAIILVAIVVLVFLQGWRAVDHSADRRAGGDRRHVRGHGRGRIQSE